MSFVRTNHRGGLLRGRDFEGSSAEANPVTDGTEADETAEEVEDPQFGDTEEVPLEPHHSAGGWGFRDD